MGRLSGWLVLVTIAASSPLSVARAQDIAGCTVTMLEQPPRQALDCGNGLVIEIEPSTLLFRGAPGAGNSFDTREGGVLIEVGPEAVPFQIRTPHAIASVRGTVFVVDVKSSSTSVLTVEGTVDVKAADGAGTVVLGPGQGADVSPGAPIRSGVWRTQRVSALLARFGR